MNKKIKRDIWIGLSFVLIWGTLSHFFYEWSGNNSLVGLFTPVSESTWEHLKLLFFPMLFYSIFLFLEFPKNDSVISAILFSTIIGLLVIPTLFYTYSGILGKNFLILDIAVFFISVLFSFFLFSKLASNSKIAKYKNWLIIITFLLMLAFFLFTKWPPNLGIFQIP